MAAAPAVDVGSGAPVASAAGAEQPAGCPVPSARAGWAVALDDPGRRSHVRHRRGAFSKAQLKDWWWLCDRRLPWARPPGAAGEPLPRDAAWLVGEGCACSYGYALRSWTPALMEEWFLQLTRAVCDQCGVRELPNSCNANRYNSGMDSVGWHADGEPLFEATMRDTLIVSLSLGASRTFQLWCMDGQSPDVIEIVLEDGDLCTMEGLCQKYYQHCVPKEPHVEGARINLTWRWITSHSKDCPLGVPAGPLRDKLSELLAARLKLERLKRQRQEEQQREKRQRQEEQQRLPAREDVDAFLVDLASKRMRLAELQRRRAQTASAEAAEKGG